VFADVKTVKPPYVDQEQHLQYLDAYEISNVAFVLASKKINLAHVSTTNSFHKDKNNGRRGNAAPWFSSSYGSKQPFKSTGT
jgi:hypothetical protein